MSQLQDGSKLERGIKAIDRYFAGFNYSHGCRMVLGIALAWFIAFRLHTDKPYWAMMTVVIVTLPMQSRLVEKFLAQLIGTSIGVIAVNVLAAMAFNDQWLFTIYMAFWLAFCSYLASSRSQMFTYGFALCGYTSAIIGFALSITPTAYSVFQISQARILEIYIGIVTAFFISMLWPVALERLVIKRTLRAKRTQVRKLYQSLLTADYDQATFYQESRQTFIDLMNLRELIFYDFLSAATNSEKNRRLYRYGHRLMRAVSGILLIDTLKRDLLITQRTAMTQYLAALSEWFSSVNIANEKWLRKPAAPKALLESEKGRHFVTRLDEKLMDILNAQLKYEVENSAKTAHSKADRSESSQATESAKPFYIPSIHLSYRDQKEAVLNAARTFSCILLGMVLWMGTQWDLGYIVLVFIGVMCTLIATYPMASKILTSLLGLIVIVGVPLSYLLKFGILIQVSTIEAAMLVILPVYFIAALMQVGAGIGRLVGHGFLAFSPFLIGFENPMNFHVARFANNAFAIIAAFIILLLIFNLIRQSPHTVRLARMKKDIMRKFNLLMVADLQATAPISEKAIRDYEAYLYSAIHQIKILPDMREKTVFMANAFLTLAILRGRLSFKQRGQHWDFPISLLNAIEREALDDALAIIEEKSQEGTEIERQAYWELQCALRMLQEFLDDIP